MNRNAFIALVAGLTLVGGRETAKGPFYFESESPGANLSLTRRNVAITQSGGVFTAHVTVKNTGSKRAKDVQFSCWLEREGDGLARKELTIERLPAHSRQVVVCELGKLGPGVYYFKSRAQWDRHSDYSTLSFRLPGPNLKVHPSHLWIVPNTPWPNQEFDARMGILNTGGIDATNVSVSVEVLNADGSAAAPSYNFVIGRINSGQEISKAVTMPGVPRGEYRLVVRIDGVGNIPEVLEKDNRTEVPLHILKPLTSFSVKSRPVGMP
ncbi:MAG: CARDB domain-containing protein [bacterium]